MTGMTAKSLLDLQSLMASYGVEVKFSFLFNESLITRARNYLVDEMYHRSDCTHLLFIDSDIAFDPNYVIHMLALDKEIVGGPYPKKSLEWSQLNKAIIKNPELPVEEYSKLTGSMVFNPVGGTEKFSVSTPIQVLETGTGFMLISRSALEKFEAAYPEQKYTPDHVNTNFFDGSRQITAFFDCHIDEVSNRYLSEDYYYCQQCRKIGIEVWLCPWFNLSHIGTHIFTGNLPAIAQHIGSM